MERLIFPLPGPFSLHCQVRSQTLHPGEALSVLTVYKCTRPPPFPNLSCLSLAFCSSITRIPVHGLHTVLIWCLLPHPPPVVSWRLLIFIRKSRLLNIQEFCKLVVKLAIVGVFTPWKLTHATNQGLLSFGDGLPARNCPPSHASSVREQNLFDSLPCPQ